MQDKDLVVQKMTRELLSHSNRRLLQTIAPSATDISSYEEIYNKLEKKKNQSF